MIRAKSMDKRASDEAFASEKAKRDTRSKLKKYDRLDLFSAALRGFNFEGRRKVHT